MNKIQYTKGKWLAGWKTKMADQIRQQLPTLNIGSMAQRSNARKWNPACFPLSYRTFCTGSTPTLTKLFSFGTGSRLQGFGPTVSVATVSVPTVTVATVPVPTVRFRRFRFRRSDPQVPGGPPPPRFQGHPGTPTQERPQTPSQEA